MSQLDDLPPDQRAVLSLLLRRQKSYEQIASALDIDEHYVRELAHGALATLVPAQASALSRSEQAELSDFVLNQLAPAERLVAYDRIEGSEPARAYAQALADELTAIVAGGQKSDKRRSRPARAPAPAPARREPVTSRQEPQPERLPRASLPQRLSSRARALVEAAFAAARSALAAPARGVQALRVPRAAASSAGPSARARVRTSARMASRPSRRAGALVIAGVALVALLALALSGTFAGGTSHGPAGAQSASATSGEAGEQSSGTGGSTGASAVKLEGKVKLTSPSGAATPVGSAEIGAVSGHTELAIEAEKLEPTHGSFYVVWLYTSPSHFEALGKAPAIGSSGSLPASAVPLPGDAKEFAELIVTRETSEHPTHPGEVVLHGAFHIS